MATLLQIRPINLIVHGYIRRLEAKKKLSNQVPDVIKDLIVDFSKHKSCFNWKDSKHGDGLTFDDNDPNIIKKLSLEYRWTFLIMKYVLSLKVCKTMEWELKLEQKICIFIWLC